MASAQRLRESIRERLAAVSQEIYAAFEQTINRYKAELECQRRLLDVVWKPDIQLRRADLELLEKRGNPEALSVLQPQDQERTSNVEEEQREAPQAIENQEQPGCSWEEDQFSNQRPRNNAENSPCDVNSQKLYVKCDVCGKAFKLTIQLKRHLRRHTSEKPYPGRAGVKAARP